MNNIDWSNPSSQYTVVCRPALPKDTADVLELTRTIWDGHDYVPYVWQEWLADPHGILVSAEYGKGVVGVGKLTKLAENQWWLEGLRVHLDYQGKGIGSHLMDYLYEYWERAAGGTVRLATASYRISVQHLSDKFGFRKLGEFSEFSAPGIAGAASLEELGFSPVVPGQESEAVDFARQSQSMSFASGLMDLGYQWVSPAPCHISEAIARREIWWWQNKRGLLVMIKGMNDNRQESPRISLLACRLEDIPAVMECFRQFTPLLGYERVEWVASLHPDLQPILLSCHFHRDWEDAVFVYEKTMPN